MAYYGWYELRLAGDLRQSGRDPVVNFASGIQHQLSGAVGRVGAGWFALLLAALVLAALLLSRRRRAPVGG
nr:hypothetical protein GCM10020092_042830 [Actinoplanes digitatis]